MIPVAKVTLVHIKSIREMLETKNVLIINNLEIEFADDDFKKMKSLASNIQKAVTDYYRVKT